MRVIAGTFAGRTIARPKGNATRPTTDRVREAMGSVLSSRGLIREARVLDLFAGSGAIGIELLSRGAATAVFVESDRNAVKVIQANLETLKLKSQVLSLEILNPKVLHRLQPLAPFDLIVADPPYEIADAALERTVELARVLAPMATLIFEYPTRTPPEAPVGLAIERAYEYGDSSFLLASLISEQREAP